MVGFLFAHRVQVEVLQAVSQLDLVKFEVDPLDLVHELGQENPVRLVDHVVE